MTNKDYSNMTKTELVAEAHKAVLTAIQIPMRGSDKPYSSYDQEAWERDLFALAGTVEDWDNPRVRGLIMRTQQTTGVEHRYQYAMACLKEAVIILEKLEGLVFNVNQ